MAIYSLIATVFSRSRGESMTAKSAYRAGERVIDRRTNQIADYRNRSGVEHTFMMFPHGLAMPREDAWNLVEAREGRRDSCVGREILTALPVELSRAGRERCARRMAAYINDTYQLFADCALHTASRQGDSRNFHLHILVPTRVMDVHGTLTTKARAWDDPVAGPKIIRDLRVTWADIANDELAREGHADVRIDPGSNRSRGIDKPPGVKMGLAATAVERRTGAPSNKRKMLGQPIEIDPLLVAAVRSFRPKRQAKQPTPEPNDVDISAVLARLRGTAARQIGQLLDAKVKADREAHKQKQRPARTRQRPASSRPKPLAGDRRTPNRGVAAEIARQPKKTPRAPTATGQIAALPPNNPALGTDERFKVWAFACAAAADAVEFSAEDYAVFSESAVSLAAAEIGVSAGIVRAAVAEYRSLGRPYFPQVLAVVIDQVRRLIDNLISRLDIAAPRGSHASDRPLDTMRHAEAAVGRAVLKAAEAADRLISAARGPRFSPPTANAAYDAQRRDQASENSPRDRAPDGPLSTGQEHKEDVPNSNSSRTRKLEPSSFEARRRTDSDETVSFRFPSPTDRARRPEGNPGDAAGPDARATATSETANTQEPLPASKIPAAHSAATAEGAPLAARYKVEPTEVEGETIKYASPGSITTPAASAASEQLVAEEDEQTIDGGKQQIIENTGSANAAQTGAAAKKLISKRPIRTRKKDDWGL